MQRSLLKGYLYVIISAVLFGCMPLGAKFIYADGVNSISLVFLRNLLSLPTLAFLILRSGDKLRISRDSLREISLMALVGNCLTPALLYASYNYISSGTATVFHFIYPAATVLGSALFLREKLRPAPVLCILLCTAGIGLFYDPAQPINLFGSGIALLSGVTYATYIILLSASRHKELSGFKFSFYNASVCASVLLIVCLPTGQLTLPASPGVWVISILFSHAICIGAIVLFQRGTFLVGGQRAAILSTFEPITSLITGITILHEKAGWRTLCGAALVILAAALIALSDSRKSGGAAGEKDAG